jgi:hypothetical protein
VKNLDELMWVEIQKQKCQYCVSDLYTVCIDQTHIHPYQNQMS